MGFTETQIWTAEDFGAKPAPIPNLSDGSSIDKMVEDVALFQANPEYTITDKSSDQLTQEDIQRLEDQAFQDRLDRAPD